MMVHWWQWQWKRISVYGRGSVKEMMISDNPKKRKKEKNTLEECPRVRWQCLSLRSWLRCLLFWGRFESIMESDYRLQIIGLGNHMGSCLPMSIDHDTSPQYRTRPCAFVPPRLYYSPTYIRTIQDSALQVSPFMPLGYIRGVFCIFLIPIWDEYLRFLFLFLFFRHSGLYIMHESSVRT